VDLLVNDPTKGFQEEGFPEYLQTSAAKYTNVAGVSFLQPSELMDANYDLPAKVGWVVQTLRKQGVAVQLLVGGEISRGWSELTANPKQAAKKAIEVRETLTA
jgi:hypothetical protein